MNDEEKKSYQEKYEQAKKNGVPFFPDIVFKDAVMSLVIFLALAALAYFLGAPLEERANPADSNYTPRPEWYFLFLFQLLKYFPGNLEVLGVVVVPSIVILALLLLPFLDKGPQRHFSKRRIVIITTGVIFAGILALTALAIQESPPPAAAVTGDHTAALYAANCAPCHGQSISVTPGTDLHAVIAQGNHEGMPAWGADISSDQIDALAGYILSPGGSRLFTQYCAACHDVTEIVSSNPLDLKQSLDLGLDYPPHSGVEIPDWSETMSSEERSRLLNFLVAPDGARLYAMNCATCHGQSVAFAGSEVELKTIISEGGLHLDMPAWRERLGQEEIDSLSLYVFDPEANPTGAALFEANCRSCHLGAIPAAGSVEEARQVIETGGPHQEMPVWGKILAPEAVDALVAYTYQASRGAPIELGQGLFANNCAACHGYFGEGGLNPGFPGTTISPISSADFLKIHDDEALARIIAQGLPDSGMSPFGIAGGGPLDDTQIAAIVTYMRSWEANPPIVAPSVTTEPGPVSVTGAKLYPNLCAQCHGVRGEGGLGPALNDPQFLGSNSDEEIFHSIDLGHDSTAMIAWGEFLTDQQINELVTIIRGFGSEGTGQPSFQNDVLPILQENCGACHGSMGGWGASSYTEVMTSGNNAPAVIPGDAANSLLVLKITGAQTSGSQMPPADLMSEADIQVIVDWINAGAPDN